MSVKELSERIEVIEETIQLLLEKQKENEILLLRIEGGMTAIKWVAAVIGFLFGIGEC
ncbi:MAG: hypothetical protein Unbinned4336contig1001_35 [Prokaryotic dsDNA virus sp.]|nr:MAG: hypothetical protein Unbinned4336contig1001_35 [Prokaryotic dsDNA virus sp.]